ncbi:VOC family protein [Yinghuangia aomiensis]|uniref:VOC family protein n=1 Tax=Yinghuangia aomiensis TaxID=676205 RepID=A0ABP9IE76_9ACTN
MSNTEFELGGVCHLALVCQDMQRTVDFYTNVLGMKLAKTVELPNGNGQHFFFDMGGGQFIAFFWFPGAPERAPGVASSAVLPGTGDIRTAHASMNHVSFKIPVDKFEEYKEKLEAKGVRTGPILNHDDSERTWSPEIHEGTYVRSMYFFDPDGILLEFAAWTRELRDGDVAHAPYDADGVPAATIPGA